MSKYKHINLKDRISIQELLNNGLSLTAISRELGKSCTSISNEVLRNSHLIKKGGFGRPFNNCANRFNCTLTSVCDKPNCNRSYCRSCKFCIRNCKQYIKQPCTLLDKPPYVCNNCKTRTKCTLEKNIYSALLANNISSDVSKQSRQGANITEEELLRINSIISPLIKRGHSVYNILNNHEDEIMLDAKTIYNYINSGLLDVDNMDLLRKVKFKKRVNKSKSLKVDKKCRIDRTYEDYMKFINDNPDISIVEMDTVEGVKGGKVLLTLIFRNSNFMLAYIRDNNTSQSVIDVINKLNETLGSELFKKLFPLLLTDNGSEFSNPLRIENCKDNNSRTKVFYCNPRAAYQKPHVENNHTLIRRIIPKGKPLDSYTQEDIDLMMSHINSYNRKRLNGESPHSTFKFFYGQKTLSLLKQVKIEKDQILLKPELLKK